MLFVQFMGCTAQFVLDLVGNPKDRFSRDVAHLYLHFQITLRLGLGRWLNRYLHSTMMYTGSKIGAYRVIHFFLFLF